MRKHRRVALIGTYPPRRCGIASFTADLSEALSQAGTDVRIAAMIREAQGETIPPGATWAIRDERPRDYVRAAEAMSAAGIDVVCVQHEYGIFGGEDGRYILRLYQELRVPIITTLHTVLKSPTKGQKRVLSEICARSAFVVVMAEKARELLQEVYGVPESRIRLIRHGVPVYHSPVPRETMKAKLGLDGRRVISTFGLLSPGKGVENVIQALPEVVRRYPETTYLILGGTHPDVVRRSGERYRQSLEAMVDRLGMADHVRFVNRFLEREELLDYLWASDLFVTPYPGKEQICSGTLTYAVGLGRAVVSTPYWYAEELLGQGAGSLVPFRDAGAMARAILEMFDHPLKQQACEAKARSFGASVSWPQIGLQYAELAEEGLAPAHPMTVR
ncbi:glycosyltransferase family 4 protein [Kyrpidia sp.]|uniref:glycosyltransferase family 4 protein n=1 Tax=Kyrpidia sp. TaxID=2073077 RepID=UPI002589E30F|nr:glycosyltransferase family 4 protein [Kyrpidia sp.]MCL6577360.1 glycosyltransferase family 4 protein [Kyrpidia sp.]